MKTKKNYPMNGPNLEIQRLMERPRANRDALIDEINDQPNEP